MNGELGNVRSVLDDRGRALPKASVKDGVVAIPASSQHEYVFCAVLLRQAVLNVLSEPVFPPNAESGE
jgi:hypothetical protein